MENYEKYIISQGGKEWGLPYADIEEHLLTPSQFKLFIKFMRGKGNTIVGGIPLCWVHDYKDFMRSLDK